MSMFVVAISRAGFNPSVYPLLGPTQEQAEYFKHDKDRIWGMVSAGNAEDAMQKLLEHAYANDLWYSIGGKNTGR